MARILKLEVIDRQRAWEIRRQAAEQARRDFQNARKGFLLALVTAGPIWLGLIVWFYFK